MLGRDRVGDTQDEPRDHWRLLADRLVARARREVLGPQAAASPSPLPGFGVTGCIFWHELPRAVELPVHASSLRCPAPHLSPVFPLPGLTPGLFRAPGGPLPAQQRQNRSPVSILLPPPPSPAVRVMNLSGSLLRGWGSSTIWGLGAYRSEWGSVAQRRAIGNGCRAVPSSANTPHLFSPFS